MNGNFESVGKMLGATPNEMFSRTGQILTIASAAVLLGIEAGGVTLSSHSSIAPWVTLGLGILSMWYGSKLKCIFFENELLRQLEAKAQNDITKKSDET